MEEEGSGSEFQDLEVLHEFDDTFPQVYSSNFPDSDSSFFQVFEGDSGSGSTILLDYFSLPNQQPNANSSTVTKPYSIDTNSENRNCRKSTTELGSESADEFNQSHANNLTDITKTLTGFEKLEREADDGVARDEPLSAKDDMYSPIESEEYAEESECQDELFDHSSSNSSGNESVVMKSGDDGKETDTGGDHIDSVNDISNKDSGGDIEDSSEKIEEVKLEAKSGEVEAPRRRDVWWKVPFQVLRYFFLRSSTAWSFSVAVAFVGMVILGRRFYKMKRKSKILLLKIAVDDKKVSQFADRAARLNEAFSVMRRVPVVRASLTGANSLPAMSMR